MLSAVGDKASVSLPVIITLLALQAVPSTAGEESLAWTELADPDPGYVPPPVTAEEIAELRAERDWAVQRRLAEERDRRAVGHLDAELRRAEQAVRNSCETVRQAIGDHPACSR